MRTLVASALVAASVAVAHDASAQGTYYPWCARYDAYAYNCGFTTWAQCQATVSGAGGICYQNPMPPSFGQGASHKRKPKRQY